MSRGVVKCICPSSVINQEEDLKSIVRENKDIIFLCFLSQTFRVHILCLQPNENKLSECLFSVMFPSFPFYFGYVLFMSPERLDVVGQGLILKWK